MNSAVYKILAQMKLITHEHFYQNFILFTERLQNKAPSTVTTYMNDLLSALTFFHKNTNAILNNFPDDIILWRDFLEYRYNYVSARTQIKNMAAFKAYARMFDVELLDILQKLHKPKISTVHPRALSQDEMDRLLEHVKDPDKLDQLEWFELQEELLWMFLYGCGLRISEALQLRTDIDITNAISVIGKGNRVRHVPVLHSVSYALNMYLLKRPQTTHKSFFITKKLSPMNRHHAAQMMSKTRARLGLPDYVTPHALRHTFVTHLMEQGVCLRAIQELVGHASLSTIQNYAQVSVQHLEKLYFKAEEQFEKQQLDKKD